MSVRRKALIITALTVLVFLSLVTWVADAIVLRGFDHLQRDTTERDVRRVVNAIQDDLTAMAGTAQDWAYWDDTYEFASGARPGYPQDNLSNDTLPPLKLSFMVLADTSGRVIASKGCDLSTGDVAGVPASVTALLSSEDVAAALATASLREGVVVLPEGPALVVAAPVLRNDRSGPPAGIQLVGRLLTPGQLANVSERTQLAVAVYPMDSDQVPRQFARAASVPGSRAVAVELLGPDTMGGYALLRDLGGAPVAVVRAEEPRTVYRHGQAVVKYVLLALALGIALVSGVNYLLLEKTVLWRLARLSLRLKEIGRSRDTAARVPVLGGDEIGELAGSINQVLTDRERAEHVIRHQAFYDGLTGLPNRALFYTEADGLLAEHASHSDPLAILCLDLDRFKMVNDTFGHHHGDELLLLVAQRLRASLREGDLACRLGGDEFAVLLPRVRAPEDATSVARRVVQAFQRPFGLDGHELYVSASVGISLYPKDGETTGQLLQKADLAMYEAKQAGGNRYELHGAHMDGRASQRLEVEEDLRRGLRRGEMAVFYQPQIEIATGAIIGLEALVRWRHPERGLLGPADFLNVAEETGLIESIGEWVLGEVCSQLRRWEEEIPETRRLRVAVNFSARELHRSNLVRLVRRTLARAGLGGNRLQVEVTEGAVMRNVSGSVAIMKDLQRLGVATALDDFGLGHSSLVSLKRLPIDTLKIDQSFVRDLCSDPNDQAIVEAIVGMAKALQLAVIAEGVETVEQLEFLRSLSCYAVQGYLIREPVEAEGIAALLHEVDLAPPQPAPAPV